MGELFVLLLVIACLGVGCGYAATLILDFVIGPPDDRSHP